MARRPARGLPPRPRPRSPSVPRPPCLWMRGVRPGEDPPCADAKPCTRRVTYSHEPFTRGLRAACT
eukprot:144962-Prymnesium_polylepis.1